MIAGDCFATWRSTPPLSVTFLGAHRDWHRDTSFPDYIWRSNSQILEQCNERLSPGTVLKIVPIFKPGEVSRWIFSKTLIKKKKEWRRWALRVRWSRSGENWIKIKLDFRSAKNLSIFKMTILQDDFNTRYYMTRETSIRCPGMSKQSLHWNPSVPLVFASP